MGPTWRSRTHGIERGMKRDHTAPVSNPTPVIDRERLQDDDRQLWYACRTRARAEKKVDRLLTAAGVVSYLPLVERVRAWSDRSKLVKFPLFPGYVFARSTHATLPDIVRTPSLIEIVRVNGAPTPIRDVEIESIRSLVLGSESIGEEPLAHEYLVHGQEVRVVQGPRHDVLEPAEDGAALARGLVGAKAIVGLDAGAAPGAGLAHRG